MNKCKIKETMTFKKYCQECTEYIKNKYNTIERIICFKGTKEFFEVVFKNGKRKFIKAYTLGEFEQCI
jgi:hypothetical protein